MVIPLHHSAPRAQARMFLASTLVLCPLSALGGDRTGIELGVGLFYDNNVTAHHEQTIDSEGVDLATRLWLTKQAHNVGTQLELDVQAAHYEKAEDFNFVDAELYSSTLFNPYGGAHTFELSARLQNQHEEPGTGVNQGDRPLELGEPVRYNQSFVTTGYRLGDSSSKGVWRLEYHFSEKNYLNFKSITEERDRRTHILSTRFDYNLGYFWSIFAEPQVRRITYINSGDDDTEQDLDSDSVLFNIGLTIGDRQGLSGSIEVGVIDKTFDARAREDFFGASWDIALTWAPNDRSALELSTQREDREPETSDNLVDVKSFALGWRQKWRENMRSNLSLGIMDSEYLGNDITLRSDELGFGQLSLEWQSRHNLAFSSSVRFTEKNSTIYQYEYNKTYGELSVSYRFY